MTAKPHHILIILAIGLAFEGLVISAASGFTLGSPFVNAYAAAILLTCGLVSAFGGRSRVAGLMGSLMGLAFTAIIGLNAARLGTKWHDTWGWLSVPTLHSFITVGACLAAFIALWRRWPMNLDERPMVPELRLAVVMLGGAATVTAVIAVKGKLPPQEASGASTAAPRDMLASGPPNPDSTILPDQPASGPQHLARPAIADTSIEFDVGPIVILAAAPGSSDDPSTAAPMIDAAVRPRLLSRPAPASSLEAAAAAFFDFHGAGVTGAMPAASSLPRGATLADTMRLDRISPAAHTSPWLPGIIVVSESWDLPGAPHPSHRTGADARIDQRVTAPEVSPAEQGETRSIRSDRRLRR